MLLFKNKHYVLSKFLLYFRYNYLNLIPYYIHHALQVHTWEILGYSWAVKGS